MADGWSRTGFRVYSRGVVITLQPAVPGWFGHREQFQFKTQEFEFRPEATRVEMGTPAVPTIYTANGGLDIILRDQCGAHL